MFQVFLVSFLTISHTPICRSSCNLTLQYFSLPYRHLFVPLTVFLFVAVIFISFPLYQHFFSYCLTLCFFQTFYYLLFQLIHPEFHPRLPPILSTLRSNSTTTPNSAMNWPSGKDNRNYAIKCGLWNSGFYYKKMIYCIFKKMETHH